MSDKFIQSDDPRLTAYALGELDPTEQREIERLLAGSTEAQAAVKEIRDLAGLLTKGLRDEPAPTLSAAQRAAILDAGAVPADAARQNGATPDQRVAALASPSRSAADFQARRTSRVKRFASLAAVAALVVVVALLVTPPSGQRSPLIANNSFHPHVVWSDRSRTDSLGMDMSRESQTVEELEQRHARGFAAGDARAVSTKPLPEQLEQPSATVLSTGEHRFAADPQRRAKPSAEAESAPMVAGSGHNGKGVPGRAAGESKANRLDGEAGQPSDRQGEDSGREGFSRNRANLRMPSDDKGGKSPAVAARKPASGPVSGEGLVPGLQTSAGMGLGKSGGPAPVAGGVAGGGSAQQGNQPLGTVVSQKHLAVLKDNLQGRGGRASDYEVADEVTRERRSGLQQLNKQSPDLGYAQKGQGQKSSSGDKAGASQPSDRGDSNAADGRDFAERSLKGLPDKPGQTPTPFGNGELFGGFRGLARGAPADSTPQQSNSFALLSEDLRDADGLGTEAYAPIVENPFLSAYEDPLSTFGVDVDTASYANVRRFLTNHQLPPRDAVRIEELVNYFSYNYPQPAAEQPFSVNVDAANCPWNPNNKLVRIGVQGKEIPRDKRPPSNLVFLVDVSGSMQAENKLPLVKMGLNLLTQQMTETDRVAIVTYSDTAVQRLESTNGANRQAILAVIDSLQAAGSTNGAAGIQLAYRAALDHFIPGGANRVILCTDGDFNVGVTSDDELVKVIEERARTKVFFSVFGFGMGNLKDGKLEKLADKGNGHYAYIDGQNEARKNFVDELTGTLVTIAKDVKLQVEFNPNQVGSYRLLGYENRVMAAADFDNDKKDAGDVGAGHSVTALYEVLPAGEAPKPELGAVLRYRKAVVPQEGALSRELLTVKLRYKMPEGDASSLVEYPIAGPVNVAAADRRPDAAFYSVQLQRLQAAPAAENLRTFFKDNRQEAPAIVVDTANRRLSLQGSSEQISQGQKRLEELGESGQSASRDFNWAAAVAAFGLLLRDSQYRGQASFDMVLELATAAKGEDPTGRRQEFIELVKQARQIAANRSQAGSLQVLSRMSREQLEAVATVDGKYKNLLRIVEAPGDAGVYGAAHDFGRWEGTSYAGQNNLPQGHWVYVYPNWYIWGDASKPPE